MELNPMPHPYQHHAVLLRHGYKNYGDVSVIKNLNMMVRHGTTYGLLGASGCGKTTLLSCVVGRQVLDAGDVRVLGHQPGTQGCGIPGKRIGYMPQETALYLNFTIRDTMRYFGWIFEMKAEDVEEKTEYLMKLLDIPSAETMTSDLSGGQKRRVSFAVALLHEPELLVLDEPTVGMDPVLREVIWEHLLQLCSTQNKTIIFTTHYVEEAKQAHMIGLMRKGCLLEEDSPGKLLQKYNCENLEDVFLHLSQRQEGGQVMQHETIEENNPDVTRASNIDNALQEIDKYQEYKRDEPKITRGIIAAGTMRALIFKNLVVSSRDWNHIGFTFGLIVIAVSSVYLGLRSTPCGLRLAVVNHDRRSSRPDCAGAPPDTGCNYDDLSCRFLGHLAGPAILKEFYNSTESAKEATRKGRVWGTLHFGADFSDAVVERALNDTRISDETLESSKIIVSLDMSNYPTGLILQQEILQAFQKFSENILVACNHSAKLAQVPMRLNDPVFGSFQLNFLNFAAPGTLIIMMFFFGVALTTWVITAERKQGLVNRNFVSGVRTMEVLLSYMVAEFVLMCGQAVILVLFSFVVYKFQCVGDIWLAIALISIQGINGILLGLVISSLCDREETTSYLAIGSLVPLLLFCGIIWPVEGMETPVRIISQLSPLTLPVKGLRAIMARGWDFYHFDIYAGFIMTFAWMIIFGAVVVIIFKFRKL